MEDLFREILASPKSTNAPLSVADSSAMEMMSIGFGSGMSEEVEGAKSEEQKEVEEDKTLNSTVTETGADDTTSTTAVDWANEIEMQSILDTMMNMSSFGEQSGMGLGMEFGIENLRFDMDFASIVGSGLAGQSWDTGVF